MHATVPLLERSDFPELRRARLDTPQVNLGYLCNQQCVHCHVNAGPKRSEVIRRETVDLVLDALPTLRPATLDLIAGALAALAPLRELGHGVVVVDGGSEDGTADLARAGSGPGSGTSGQARDP
ncbi:MAG: hypothetical protein HY778_17310 [Betaproteobacteria bacterium]|nr:hypothetical protein [Betaproteobacteria bacterium]